MNSINISSNVILKYILYLFPILVIIGNAAINSAMLIVFFIYFLRCLSQKKIIFTDTHEFKFFLYFYLYLLINSLLSEDIKSSLIRTIPYIKFFIFVLIYKNFIEEKKIDLKNLGLFWLIVITILSLDIIYQSIFGFNVFNFSTVYTSRNSGLFFDELVAGGFLLSFIFITIFLIIKKTNYLYLYLYFIFCLVVIFLTGERANFLKFTFVLICVYYFLLKSGLIFKNISLLVPALIILLLMSNFEHFKNRYWYTISFSSNNNLSLVDSYLTSEYGSHTVSSFLILKDNLFFGVGNKNFRNLCKNYKTEVIEIQKKIDNNAERNYPSGCSTHPHQIYNEFLSEHGLFGTLILFFLFFKLIFKNLSINKNSNLNLVCFYYLVTYFIPIIPSGSFFSTLTSTLFWINFMFYIVNIKKDD
jgi:O-antigen ligase